MNRHSLGSFNFFLSECVSLPPDKFCLSLLSEALLWVFDTNVIFQSLISVDCKTEDLAAALLDMICKNIVANAVNSCLISNAKHVFIVGTFAAHPRARDIIMAEFEYKKHWLAATLDTCVSMIY